MQDENWMRAAIEEAKKALAENEVPIGAVVVRNNMIIAAAHNDCIAQNDPTRHAECIAMKDAYRLLGSLDECTLYVTMEPCAMCAGTMLTLRLPRLVFGAFNQITGCCGSKIDLTDHWFDGNVQTIGGILESECKTLLGEFFSKMRTNNK